VFLYCFNVCKNRNMRRFWYVYLRIISRPMIAIYSRVNTDKFVNIFCIPSKVHWNHSLFLITLNQNCTSRAFQLLLKYCIMFVFCVHCIASGSIPLQARKHFTWFFHLSISLTTFKFPPDFSRFSRWVPGGHPE